MEENIGYFRHGGAADDVAVGRFLTANFGHIALTGLCGFACYRMIRFPRSCWEQFLATFLLMVTAHGIYDAVLILNLFNEYSFVSIIILAALAYRYFMVADSLWMTGSHQVSPLGIFVIGFACIIGVSLNVVCFGLPPHPTYLEFAVETVSLIPIVFLFVNQFRNA